MTNYIISSGFALVFLLIAALISSMIKYEGGANPSDPKKRKVWFWVFAILNPAAYFSLSAFVLAPDKIEYPMEYDEYMAVVPIAAAVGFVAYILLGFIISKIFKNGKLGNWF